MPDHVQERESIRDEGERAAPIRICLISPVPPPNGGMGRWTTLVRRWAEGEPSVSIVQVDTSPRWRAIDDLAVWKRVIGGGIQLVRDYGIFLRAVRSTDVVHLATSGSLATVRDLFICVTARLMKVPVIYHLHFGKVPEITQANGWQWRFLSCVMRLADMVLALDGKTTETIGNSLLHVKVISTPNPIDLDSLPAPVGPGSGKRTVLFLGWVLPSKGVEELLRAWETCAEEPWELVLAGPLNPGYRDQLASRYRTDSVSFAGELPYDRAMRLLAECDLFVLPSHTEAFPYVVLEAMSLGKAIVATRVGAIPEMLAGGCGEVVPPREVGGLASALLRMMKNETLRRESGVRARERVVACYSLPVVMESIASHWQRLAARRPVPRK